MNIELNGIIDGVISVYHVVSSKAVEWYGRGVSVLKSGFEIASPYLQDKRIAVISLIAVNLILIEVGGLFEIVITRILPNKTEGQKNFAEVVKILTGLIILGSGVAAFSKYAKLPLNLLTIALVSVATLLIRAPMTPMERVPEGKKDAAEPNPSDKTIPQSSTAKA